MASLKNQALVPLFTDLMQQVVGVGTLDKAFLELSQKELLSLSHEINSAGLPEGEIAQSTLRDYKLMCEWNPKKPLAVSHRKLSLLCRYADFPTSQFFEKGFDEEDDSIKLLITQDFFEEGAAHLAKRLRRRYLTIKEQYEVENLEVKIEEMAEAPNNQAEAKDLAKKHKADFLVWGESIPPSGMKYRLLLTNPEKYDIHSPSNTYFSEKQTLTSLSELCEGEVLLEPEYLLFFVLGIITYQKYEDNRALDHWLKVIALKDNISDGHFYLGVLRQNLGQLTKAKSHYESALKALPLGHDIKEKASINLAIALIQEGGEKNYGLASELLNSLDSEDKMYLKNKYALLFQLSLLQKQPEEANNALLQWGNTEIKQYQPILDQVPESPTLAGRDKESFLVLKGNRLAQVLPNGAPAIENITLLKGNDKLFSKGEPLALTVVSLTSYKLYRLDVSRKASTVKESISVLDEFKVLRSSMFEQHSEAYPWIILDPTLIPIKNYNSHPNDIFIIQFKWNGEIINNTLTQNDGCLCLDQRSIFRNKNGEILDLQTDLKDVRIIAYNQSSEEQSLLYHVPGFVFMEYQYLKGVIKRFKSFLPALATEDLNKRVIEFVYQSFGTIPEDYLMND